MKQRLFAAVAAFMFAGGSAVAADLPAKAPYYKAPPAAYYNWSGFYIGGQGGWAFDGKYDWAPEFPTIHSGLDGGFGGGTVGYNWQVHRFVLGLEADYSWADITGDFKGAQCSATFSCSAKIES